MATATPVTLAAPSGARVYGGRFPGNGTLSGAVLTDVAVAAGSLAGGPPGLTGSVLADSAVASGALGTVPPGAAPTLAGLWADTDLTTTSTALPVTVSLDAAAQVAHEVEIFEQGVSRGVFPLAVGEVGITKSLAMATQGTRQLDFEIRLAGGAPSGLTRLRRPLDVTVYDTAARLVCRYADVAKVGKWDVFYVHNIGASATTFTPSATNGTVFDGGSVSIAPGQELPVSFKPTAAGNSIISVTSAAPVINGTKTIAASVYTPPTVPTPLSASYEAIVKPLGFNWLGFERWFQDSGGAAYDRYCKPLAISPISRLIRFFKYTHKVGRQSFTAGEVYQLVMWERPPTFAGRITMASLGAGSVIDSITVATSGIAYQEFNPSLSGMTQGWKIVDIEGPGGFLGVPFWMYVSLDGTTMNQDLLPWLPTATHSFDSHFDGSESIADPYDNGKWDGSTYNHHLCRIPNRALGLEVPLPRRERPAFSDMPATRTQFVAEALTGSHGFPVEDRAVVQSIAGADLPILPGYYIRHTFNKQKYFKGDFFGPVPRLVLQDGKRGQSRVWAPSNILPGRAIPDNTGFRGAFYINESHRVLKLTGSGEVITLAGYRHRHPGFRPGDDHTPDQVRAELELVGDWSAIPLARRGFHELWGATWDPRTLPINVDMAPIAAEENQRAHVLPVRQWVADSQNNRVCLLTFPDSAATSSNPRHGGAVVVTEWITGMGDPWGLEYWDGKLIVTERLNHRISVWSADVPNTLLYVLASGPALSSVDANRQPFRAAPLATIRAQTIVGPEGLVVYTDPAGRPWAVVGSWAMAQIKMFALDNPGESRVLVNVDLLDNNALWMHLSMSPGGFAPYGTIFMTTWSAGNASGSVAMPEAWKVDGSRWQWYAGNDFDEAGLPYPNGQMGYPTASGVGGNCMVFGGAAVGFWAISRKLASDTVVADYRQGKSEYIKLGLAESHGPGGYSSSGHAPPFGITTPIDSYLVTHGHTPP
jgi:hypothetical protein